MRAVAIISMCLSLGAQIGGATTYADRPLAFGPAGAVFTTRYSGFGRYSIIERSLPDGNVVHEYPAARCNEAISIDAASKRLMAAGKGRLVVWTLNEPRPLCDVAIDATHVLSGTFSPSGNFIALAHYSGILEVVAADSGELRAKLRIPGDDLIAAAVDDLASWAVVSGLNSTYFVELASGQYRRILSTGSPEIRLFSDGVHVAIGRDDSQVSVFAMAKKEDQKPYLLGKCTCSGANISGLSIERGVVVLIKDVSTNGTASFSPAVLKEDCHCEPVRIMSHAALPLGPMSLRGRLSADGLLAGFATHGGNVYLHSFENGEDWMLASVDSSDAFSVAAVVGAVITVALWLAWFLKRKERRRGWHRFLNRCGVATGGWLGSS